MAKGVFVVQSSALDAQHESAFDEWYHSVHIPEILDVPGFTGARRFRIVDGAQDAHPYLTIYEIEADDVRAPLQEMYRRAQTGEMSIPDHVMKAKAPSTILYELTGEY